MSIFLETKRLILKLPSLSDLDDLIKLRSDPDVMRYIGDGSTHTKSQVESFLKDVLIPYQEKHGFGFCSVFEKETAKFIGQAGLFHKGFCDQQPDIELAYRLHKKYWGKGYATELVIALIHWGFENIKIDKIVSAAEPENIASQKVLLKSGFLFLGKQKWRDGRELFYYEIYKNDAIVLSPYNKEWPQIAEREIKKLYDILPNQHIIDIQHVGSTAIPNMIAKPVIDIQIAVYSLNVIKRFAIDLLKTEGYMYWAENPDPERLFFVKDMPPFGEKRTFHIHIVELNSKHWHEKILFRDYLRSHPEDIRKYAKLKYELTKEHTYDREAYTDAKSKFIQEILKKASNDVPQFNFKPLTANDLELLCDWLEKPHILEWWNDRISREELKEKYSKHIGDSIICPYIVFIDSKPIGFIQYYWASKVGDGWWLNEDDHTVGTDQFIGEIEYLNKGYGTLMMKAFVDFLFKNPEIHKIITEAAPNNIRAQRSYEKAGFKKSGLIKTPVGDSVLMIINRKI